ncbi:MAG TPA: TetR/AcrR family transcriptional regulator [Casimicrobiaceae bacterium]
MNAGEKAEARKPAQPRRIKTATKNLDLVRERRETLINAAIRVFVEKGFHNATVRDIGREAAMTQGTIYNYVSSKDDILYMVCDRIVAEYNAETRRALELAHDPVGRVRSAVRAISEVMYRHRREILLIYQDSHLLEPRSLRVILARVEEFIGMFERIIADAARELGVPLRHPHLAANILTFLPVMIALRGWSLRANPPPEDVIAGISEFVVRGLGFASSEPRG